MGDESGNGNKTSKKCGTESGKGKTTPKKRRSPGKIKDLIKMDDIDQVYTGKLNAVLSCQKTVARTVTTGTVAFDTKSGLTSHCSSKSSNSPKISTSTPTSEYATKS